MQPPFSVMLRRGHWVTAATLESASAACRQYLDENCYGGSDWNGGTLKDATGRVVGHVSYNGKVWAGRARDWQPGDRPLYSPYLK